ncbi:MAG: hypothetical protein AAGG72_09235 [Pseudomonadota bacterium]
MSLNSGPTPSFHLTATKPTCAALALGALLCVAAASPSLAAPDGAASDRFSMAPVEGGFIRLDKQTGDMAICRETGSKWACSPMGSSDEQATKELERLKAENADLQAEVRRMEQVFGLDGRSASGNEPGEGAPNPGPLAGGPPGGLPKFDLPSEKDVDSAVDYLEGMIRKFRERFEDFGAKTDPNRPRQPPSSDRDSSADEGPTQL